MNKSKQKTYSPQARKDFIAAVTARANLLGFPPLRFENLIGKVVKTTACRPPISHI